MAETNCFYFNTSGREYVIYNNDLCLCRRGLKSKLKFLKCRLLLSSYLKPPTKANTNCLLWKEVTDSDLFSGHGLRFAVSPYAQWENEIYFTGLQ